MRTLVLATLLTACGGNAPSREPDEYVGCATDEHWLLFDDQELAKKVMESSTLAPQVTAPPIGSTFAFSDKPIFHWNQDPDEAGDSGGDVPADCPQWNLGGLSILHLPVVSGDLYDLQFSISGAVFYRVITSLQEWTPPATANRSMIDAWKTFRNRQVSLKIVRAKLLRNDLPSDTYAYAAATPFAFTVSNW